MKFNLSKSNYKTIAHTKFEIHYHWFPPRITVLQAARSQAPLAAIIINFGRARIIAHPDRSILGTFVQKGAKLVFLKLIASVRSIQC